MTQLLLHLWGDYILQSNWMAQNKAIASVPAAIHATIYSLLFLFLKPSLLAFAIILITHFLIDRFRLARFVVTAKNILLGPASENALNYVTATGYPKEMPMWMSIWLLIIADNTLHLTINFLALRFA